MCINKICIKYKQNINKMFMIKLSLDTWHSSYKYAVTFLPLSSRFLTAAKLLMY